jgi:acyl carrier protein
LILALEQEFTLQFEPEEMDEMSSVDHILAVLARKLEKTT